MEAVLTKMHRKRAKTKIVILDAARRIHSNAVSGQSQSGLPRLMHPRERLPSLPFVLAQSFATALVQTASS